MLAFVTKNHALTAVRKPLPTLQPGWALIRVRLAGICNTDVEILRGYHNFHRTPGHEFVGEVVRVAGTNIWKSSKTDERKFSKTDERKFSAGARKSSNDEDWI